MRKDNTISAMLTKEDIKHLPRSVQNYIAYTRTLGKTKLSNAKIEQIGYINVDGKWRKLAAKQEFDFLRKSFSWKARIGLVRVTDLFVEEKGLLKVKLLGLIKVAEISGEEIDQGEALRLLSEMIWFPSAFVSDYIHWQEIDENTAKASIKYGGKNASATFYFEPNGKVRLIKAKRYMEHKGKFSLEDWEVGNFEYREFNGTVIPYKGEISWKLKQGRTCYCKIELTEVLENIK